MLRQIKLSRLSATNLFFALLFPALLFMQTSCGDDSEDEMEMEQDPCAIADDAPLLKRYVRQEEGLSILAQEMLFEYEAGRISKWELHEEGEWIETNVITYEGDTSFIERTTPGTQGINSRFHKSWPVAENLYYLQDSTNGFNVGGDISERSFDSQNCGMIMDELQDSNDFFEYIFRNIYEYDNNCNVTRKTETPFTAVMTLSETELDGKNKPFHTGMAYFPCKLLMPGNTVRFTRYDLGGNPWAKFNFDAIFTYDDADYPLTEIRNYDDGKVENGTYEYY